ncbi:MAG: lytic transglycosylase domain-containing protein [Novosphingobium sp.]
MRRARSLVAALALAGMPFGPAAAQTATPDVSVERSASADSFAGYAAEAAQHFGIPTAWISAVIAAESAGDAHAVSPKGAMGLMQIMPETWDALRQRYALGNDPFDPRANILAGSAYLREMLDRYGPEGFLAAYNAGPQRYADHLATGKPLPAETRAYLARLMPMIDAETVGKTSRSVVKVQDALFAGHAGDALRASAAGLFVRFRVEIERP